MAEETFNAVFEGYWLRTGIGGLPHQPGIYCVYSCAYHPETDHIQIGQLIYIGEGEDVNQSLAANEGWPQWERLIAPGETFCVAAAPVQNPEDRCRIVAACVFYHQPPGNQEAFRDRFPYDQTVVNTAGSNALLSESFLVMR
jgi:hypothetical protein